MCVAKNVCTCDTDFFSFTPTSVHLQNVRTCTRLDVLRQLRSTQTDEMYNTNKQSFKWSLMSNDEKLCWVGRTDPCDCQVWFSAPLRQNTDTPSRRRRRSRPPYSSTPPQEVTNLTLLSFLSHFSCFNLTWGSAWGNDSECLAHLWNGWWVTVHTGYRSLSVWESKAFVFNFTVGSQTKTSSLGFGFSAGCTNRR